MYKNLTEFKKAWVKALRSGQYRQVQGLLCDTGKNCDSFCCLGVAGNLLIEAGHNFEWAKEDGLTHLTLRNITTQAESDELLDQPAPAWLKKWLERHQDHVVNMNDGGYGFKQIAAYIEEAK